MTKLLFIFVLVACLLACGEDNIENPTGTSNDDGNGGPPPSPRYSGTYALGGGGGIGSCYSEEVSGFPAIVKVTVVGSDFFMIEESGMSAVIWASGHFNADTKIARGNGHTWMEMHYFGNIYQCGYGFQLHAEITFQSETKFTGRLWYSRGYGGHETRCSPCEATTYVTGLKISE